MVWYNQMKLKALKAKLAQGSSSSSDKAYSSKSKPEREGGLAYLGLGQQQDLEQPLLQNRAKEDILAEIQRLQAQVEALDARVGVSAAGNAHSHSHGHGQQVPAGVLGGISISTVARLHGSGGGSSSSHSGGSSSSSPCLSVGSSNSKLEHRS